MSPELLLIRKGLHGHVAVLAHWAPRVGFEAPTYLKVVQFVLKGGLHDSAQGRTGSEGYVGH
jgi:hypothetical protein